jgi:hypothetical protein
MPRIIENPKATQFKISSAGGENDLVQLPILISLQTEKGGNLFDRKFITGVVKKRTAHTPDLRDRLM